MGYNIGPTISVQGEAEFNRAMNTMRQNMKYVSAEASAATSIYGKNEKSVASLTAKNTELEKAIKVQKGTMAAIQEQMEKLVKKGLDPSNEKYKQLKANLDNATAAANRTEVEIKENEAAMGELQKISSGLGDTVKNLADKFGVALPDGAQKGIDALNKVDASTVAFVAVTAKAIGKLIEYSVEASKTADNLLTLSSTTGLSTDQLQEFQYASELVDVSLDTLTGGMTKMIKSMDAAREGSGAAAEAYKKLGVKIIDARGELRDANTVFYETIDKLGKIKNETERDAMAMQLFGKSARELNPLIEAGSQRLTELAEEVHRMGYVMSEEALGRLGELDDAFQRFNNQSEALKNTLAMALLPILVAIMELISSIPPDVIATIAIIGTVVITIISVIKAVKSVTDVLDTFSGKSMKTTLIILGVVAALIALAAIIAVIAGKGKDLENAMSGVGKTVGGINQTVMQAQTQRYATGTNAALGGLALIGEEGPEIVNLRAGTQVFTNKDSMRMLLQSGGGGGGGDVFYVNIDAKNVKEFNDVVRIAKGRKTSVRAGYAGRK